jgi:hypothetical protein
MKVFIIALMKVDESSCGEVAGPGKVQLFECTSESKKYLVES